MTPQNGRSLGIFQKLVPRKIIGGQTNKRVHGIWEYLLLEITMEEAGFEEMGAYVLKRQNLVAYYITTWLILDLCEETVHRFGA